MYSISLKDSGVDLVAVRGKAGRPCALLSGTARLQERIVLKPTFIWMPAYCDTFCRVGRYAKAGMIATVICGCVTAGEDPGCRRPLCAVAVHIRSELTGDDFDEAQICPPGNERFLAKGNAWACRRLVRLFLMPGTIACCRCNAFWPFEKRALGSMTLLPGSCHIYP